jgi:hypothetical protein
VGLSQAGCFGREKPLATARNSTPDYPATNYTILAVLYYSVILVMLMGLEIQNNVYWAC